MGRAWSAKEILKKKLSIHFLQGAKRGWFTHKLRHQTSYLRDPDHWKLVPELSLLRKRGNSSSFMLGFKLCRRFQGSTYCPDSRAFPSAYFGNGHTLRLYPTQRTVQNQCTCSLICMSTPYRDNWCLVQNNSQKVYWKIGKFYKHLPKLLRIKLSKRVILFIIGLLLLQIHNTLHNCSSYLEILEN
jgi:hypothetical protein